LGVVKGLFFPAVDEYGRIQDLVAQGTFLAHPAVVVRTEVARRLAFDTKYRVAADYDFMLRLHSETQNYRYLPYLLSYFQTEGTSERIGSSELFSVQLQNWPQISLSLDTTFRRRRYYRFLLERRASMFHQHEKPAIDSLMKLVRLPLPVRFLISTKFLLEWKAGRE
jgi:hypothetical protein